MLRFLLPLYAALLLATALSAQTPDEPLRGLLWEISGNNIAQKGYLYGTMHVPEKLAFNLSDSFFIALRQVDIVALETDHDRWQEFTELLDGRESELFNPGYGNSYPGSGRSLPQPNLYNAQFQLSAPDNPLLGAMLSAKPRLTNEFLYRSNQYRQDYEEDTYLDLFIFQAGRKLGKSVIGLETLEDSYEALVRAQLPDEEEEESSHRDHYTGSLGRQTLEDAYRDQNLSLMDSLNRLASPGKNFQRWMLDERNLVMVDGIDSILQSGHAVFAAVGAAHLPGASGLIRQLRERGYRLRPVGFSADSSKLEKDRIDALRYPLQFSRQWAADSSWSVEAPGRFFQTVDGMGLEQQLCADMSNGAYYAVYRLQSFGLWQGQSPEYIAERIDSLIYEKVPGKIQERRRFSSPYPGHEILTRTRRGDAIRYKVVVTPMEVYVFATGGNGDYAAGEEGARFINSIAFGLKTSGTEAGSFTRLSPPEGGFSLTFPGTTVLNTTNNPKTDRYLAASVDPVDSAFYLFYRASFHDWNYIEEDSFELNIISEKIAEQFTEAAPECQLVVETPYPTQDAQFQAERDSAWYYLRLIIAGPNYYLLGCRKKQAGAPRSFFESFELQERQYPKGWETLRDTSMFFTAEIPHAALKPDRPFFTRLQRVIQEAMQKSRRGGGFNSNGSGNQVRILQLPLQGEAVSIGSFTLQNPGGGPASSLDSFQSFMTKMLTADQKMLLRDVRWDNPSDSLLSGHFLIADSNSTRGIRARITLTPGRLYTLFTTIQLDQPASPFIERLFSRFTPTDTTSGVLPFGRRNLSFLKDIYSPDSLLREKALQQLGNDWLRNAKPEDFPAYRQALEQPGFSALQFAHRQALLHALGNFQSGEALDLALKILARYPDSLRYRQVLLVALANMQTEAAQKALFRELANDEAFVSDDTVSGIFDALSDSLQLTARQIGALIDLSGQEVYREEVAELAGALQANGWITPKNYKKLKPQLIREAYQYLGQKQLAAEMEQDGPNEERYRMPDYSARFASGSDHALERNLRLLAPFLKNDARVRTLFGHAAQSPDKTVQILALSLLLQEGRPVQKNRLQAFATDDHTRYTLYRRLADVEQLGPFSDWFSDTLALVQSILYAESGWNNNGIDSLRFLSQHAAFQYKSPSRLYFFEVKQKKDPSWQLAYVNIPLHTGLFAYAPHSDRENDWGNRYAPGSQQQPEVKLLGVLSEKEKETYIRKKVGEARFANRERYRKWGGREEFYFEE